MVWLVGLMLSAVWLGEASIKVLGVVVEQSLCLVVLMFSMVWVEVQWEVTSQVDSVQIGLGWVAMWEVGLAWLCLVPMNQIHCLIQEFGSHSMVLDLAVPISFLPQGSNSL